jgi:hypothetical protein
MKPAALCKAEALIRHASYLGCLPSEFKVTLSLGEGYELLDYLAAGGMGRYANHALLERDIEEAKIAGDPWRVLEGWTLLGLELVPAASLH